MARNAENANVKTLKNVVIQLRNDTAANWASSTYVLAQGELGLDRTNNVIKIGDGTHTFGELPNAGSVIAEASAYDADTNPGGKDAEHGGIKVNGTDINVYNLLAASTTALGGVKSAADVAVKGAVAVDASGNMTVQYVDYADELKTARNISINENGTYAGGQDVVATGVAFKGNQNIDLAAALTTTGVTANTGAGAAPYVAVKVDDKGRVTAGTVAVDFKATDSALGLVQGHVVSNNAEENQDKVFVDADGKLSIQEASKAAKLTTARTISVSGDATGSASFDGSANADIALTLADTTTAGEKAIVTVDSKGRVTDSRAAVTSDISDAVAATTGTSDAAKAIKTDASGELDDSFLKAVTRTDAAADNTATEVITGFTTDTKGRVTGTSKMVATATGGAAADSGKLVKLGADGKLDDSIIPALAIGEVRDYASVAAMNAGVATDGVQSGDVAVVTNTTTPTEDGVYIYTGSAYVLIKVPGTAIQTVNGKTGPAVVLSTDDVSEGTTNQYFTAARVYTAIHSVSARDASNSFSDAAKIVFDDDTFVIECGSAAGETTGA